MNKEEKLTLIGYILLAIGIMLNVLLILPGALIFWLIGYFMSGGIHNYISCISLLFGIGVIPYLFSLPFFLAKGKRTFLINSTITLIVHLILSIVYTGIFIKILS